MSKVFRFLLVGIVILSSLYSALAVIDMLSFEASLFDSNGDPINGNITIEIYDAATGDNLILQSDKILHKKARQEFKHG